MQNYDAIGKAYAALYESKTSTILYEELLTENAKIDFLKNKYPEINTSHDGYAVHRKASDVIDFLATVDPTEKKLHTQKLVQMYHAGKFKQEDAPRVSSALQNFESKKSMMPIESRDFGKYKTITELEHATAPYLNQANTLAARRSVNKDLPGIHTMYDDEHITIKHVGNEASSQKAYGAPVTKWCTAWNTNCRYNQYNQDGPLFAVHRKTDGALFQYHPASGDFMDSNDDKISDADFASIKPSLHKAWSENPRQLLHGENLPGRTE